MLRQRRRPADRGMAGPKNHVLRRTMMTTKAYTFQLQDVRQIHRLGGRALCAQEQGLGKTLISLLHFARHPELRPAVVVCPASLKWQWRAESARHIGAAAHVLEGTRPALQGLPTNGGLYVVNYDVIISRRRDKGRAPGPGWLDWLLKLKPKLVILDEGQAISNGRAKRSKAAIKLCRVAPSVLILSGTPLTNRPAELFPLLNALWPKRFPSLYGFAHKWCAPKRTPWGWDFSGASDLPGLHAALKDAGMIRRLKRDVLDQLPAKTRQVVPLEIADRGQYEEAVHDFRKWLRKNYSPGRVRKAVKAQSLAKLTYLRMLLVKLKLPAVIDWVETRLEGSEGKLILFGVHTEPIMQLHARWKNSVVITGSVVGRDRELAVQRFQKDAKVRVLLGNIKAAGVGLNLTAASDVAFMEYGWAPASISQGEDRANRIGSRCALLSSFLVARNTFEEDHCKMLTVKQKTLDAVLDGGKVVGSLDIQELLLKKIAGF